MGGINHYQYAPNPVNWVDPLGLSCKEQNDEEFDARYKNLIAEQSGMHLSVAPVSWLVEGLADAANAIGNMFDTGISAQGVALTAVALIPGKTADKALEPVIKKLDDVAETTRTTAVQGAKNIIRKMDKYDVACFTPGKPVLSSKSFSGNKKKMEKEFYQQIKNQEEGINNLTVGEYLENRVKYKELGRDGISDGKAQKKAGNKLRKRLEAKFKEEIIENKIATGKEATTLAKERAKKSMGSLAALHDPDMIAGGNDKIKTSINKSGMGNTNINSSLGSQWKHRVDDMDIAAEAAMNKHGPNAKMNVNLSRCKI